MSRPPGIRSSGRRIPKPAATSAAEEDLLKALPEGRARLQAELELSFLLGKVLMATKGWGATEVEGVFHRARTLCEELKDEARYLQATWGLMWASVVRAKFGRPRNWLGRCSPRRKSSVTRFSGSWLIWNSAEPPTPSGTLTRLAGISERPSCSTTRTSTHLYITRLGVDVGLFSRSWESHFLWHRGYPDRARAKAAEAVNLAGQLSHPLTRTITLAYATMLNQFQRDFNEIDRLAKATISYTTEHGFPYYLAWAEVLEGWSAALRGVSEDGIAKIRSGIEVLQTMAGLRLPYYRALLAEACGATVGSPRRSSCSRTHLTKSRKPTNFGGRRSFTGYGESCFDPMR